MRKFTMFFYVKSDMLVRMFLQRAAVILTTMVKSRITAK